MVVGDINLAFVFGLPLRTVTVQMAAGGVKSALVSGLPLRQLQMAADGVKSAFTSGLPLPQALLQIRRSHGAYGRHTRRMRQDPIRHRRWFHGLSNSAHGAET